jgi:hypothetical protein
MPSRRFALLAGVLVTLNLVLWLAPPGLALRTIVLAKLFGPHLVRAEVIDSCGSGCTTDTRVDRGIVVSVTGTGLTLREADGRQQTIALGASTRAVANGHALPVSALSRGWRVLVTWPATGAAVLVKVEARHSAGGPGGKAHPKAGAVGRTSLHLS